MSRTKILVVEDDHQTKRRLKRRLEREGFRVETAETGLGALKIARKGEFDAVLLDICLPSSSNGSPHERLDGLRVLERLRRDSDVPVLMLTETSSAAVKVLALESGADDYVTKPFDLEEIVARIRAILRRGSPRCRDRVMRFRGLRIDTAARRLWKDETEVESLTPLEYELLVALARKPGWVFSRRQLIQRAWKFDRHGDERVVDTHIGHLRKKIEDDPRSPQFVVTVRGAGYRFEGRPE